jgi:putative endonuclease
MFNIYFLKSLKNGKVYVGLTERDPKLRLQEHNQGVSSWTKDNRPLVLLYYESYYCKKDATGRELFYKSGFGRKIRDIIIGAVSAKGGPASGGS